MSILSVSNIKKIFNKLVVLDDISFTLEQNEILCLLGPSGCGKTTMLRIIAGLTTADSGQVLFDGTDLTPIEPHLRNFGMMFQQFALFPHMNVSKNIAFGLEVKKLSRGEIAKITDRMLDIVGLAGFGDRKIAKLSGGERQRVALARSLAPNPRLLLLDEPLGSMDQALREKLLLEMHTILKRVGVSAVFVTHDQTEAFTISDTVAVMGKGKILQIDTPQDLYQRPKNIAVANFLGFKNLIDGKIISSNEIDSSLGVFKTSKKFASNELNKSVTLLIKHESATPCSDDASKLTKTNVIRGVIQNRWFRGKTYQIRVKTDLFDKILFFELADNVSLPRLGERITLSIDPSYIVTIPK